MKFVYWISTMLVAVGLGMGGFGHLTHQPAMVAAMQSLGYPAYMMTILGSAKIAAAITLIIPGLTRLKEWAYAGCTFLLVGAAWSHLVNHQPPVAPLVVLVLLFISYFSRARQSAALQPQEA